MSIEVNFDDEQTFSIVEHFAESLPGGFFIYHADGDENFIYVNNAMLRIFGCDMLEEFKTLTKNSFHTMVHPDDIDEVEKSISKQIKNNSNNLDYVEYRIIRKDGTIRWIVDYGHFIHLKNYGDVFYVFIDDATEKKQLELDEKREKSVIEGLSSGFNSIYLVNTQDDTVLPYAWNDPVSKEIVEQIFHNSITETNYTEFAKNFTEKYVIDPDKTKFLEIIGLEAVQEKITNKEDVLYVFRGGKKNHNSEYVQLTISPVKGTTFLAVIAMKTVTEQMQKIKAETLEKLLIEQERDNAIHANNAKSAFLFNMSHDLKTPLNAIVGFAELARKNVDGDKKRISDYLEKIETSSALLVELINDVLSMSEIESGNLTLDEEPCNLQEQITLLGDIFKAQIAGKNLNYSVSFKVKHNHIIADALNLKRIFSNLLQNAVNFTNEGGDISFSVCEENANPLRKGTYNYTFTITDTGCGMSPEFMSKMFTAFEREQNTTKSHVAGTGLGLTITKNLVEAMLGTIKAESEVGKGTTFTVKIPLKSCDEQSNPENDSKQTEKSWMHHAAQDHKRLLLVEDNELNREIAFEIAKAAGFEVEAACDGQEAVEIFTSKAEKYFDVVLMDIQMPRMDGYEATRTIRALQRKDATEIPIFALTANTLESDKLRAYESGMNEVIEKPVDIRRLEQILSEL